MNNLCIERKIIYSLVFTLIAIQLAIFVILRGQNARIADEMLREVVDTGARVTVSLLETRQKQLDESIGLLAGDFGLREAIASRDKPTVASMLDNHEKRAKGLFVAVHDLDHHLLAKSNNLPPGQRLDALARAIDNSLPRRRVNMTSLDSDGKTIYHLSTAEVRVPVRMAWISMGFAIGDEFARELSRQAGMQFMFLSRQRDGAWRVHGSTLPAWVTATAFEPGSAPGAVVLADGGAWTVENNDERYMLSTLPLSSGGASEVIVVIGKSFDQAMHPLRRVELALLYLIVGSLLLSAGAVYWVTLRIVKPMNDSANHDVLTGLFNRRHFDLTLQRLVDVSRFKGRPLGVLMLDLNKFKVINDQLGHAAGDEVLKVVGLRLKQSFRASDTVARLGGDEFAVILPGIDRTAVVTVAENIARQICAPFEWGTVELSVGTSIGIAMLAADDKSADQLMQRADKAMYASKAAGSVYELGDVETGRHAVPAGGKASTDRAAFALSGNTPTR